MNSDGLQRLTPYTRQTLPTRGEPPRANLQPDAELLRRQDGIQIVSIRETAGGLFWGFLWHKISVFLPCAIVPVCVNWRMRNGAAG